MELFSIVHLYIFFKVCCSESVYRDGVFATFHFLFFCAKQEYINFPFLDALSVLVFRLTSVFSVFHVLFFFEFLMVVMLMIFSNVIKGFNAVYIMLL